MVEIPAEIQKYGFKINQNPGGVEKTVYNNLVIMKNTIKHNK